MYPSATLTGQKKQMGSITGNVKDGESNKPLPFVTVSLKITDSLNFLTGQITNEEGVFDLSDIPFGSYIIDFQFVGFKKVIKEVSIITKDKVNLGEIVMLDDVEILNEVEVTTERSTIEQKVDRRVINIGKDLATVGPTAADLMVNLPSINVDQNGTISMRGNDNVIVLVDGKPTNQSASQLLQQIPSGSIKSIELITNPSAKYVPEGMSGIINIILHKRSNLGFNGIVTGGLTIGHKLRNNSSVDLNYKAGNANFFLNYANTDGPLPTEGTINRTEEPSDEKWFALNDRTSHLIKAGLDVDISQKTTVSFYSIFNAFQNGAFRSTDIIFPNAGLENFGQEYRSEVDNSTTTFNFDIKNKLGSNSTLEFEVDFSQLNGDERADFEFYGTAFAIDQAAEQISTHRKNSTINLDYETNFSSNIKLEVGLEARLQNVDNLYNTSNPNFLGGTYDLNRDIYSAYVNYSQKIDKWSYQIGARFEAFDQQSLFNENGNDPAQFNDLIRTIYPSAFLSYIPNPETQRDAFNFIVSRRVDRPNLNQLNPMRAWSSARITNVGNPSLFPQFTNSAEVNYTRQFKKGSVTAGIFYRKIFDEITRFGFNDPSNPSNILFSYENYQNNNAFGVEFSSNIQITDKWSLNSSFDLYSQTQKGVAQDVFREVRNVIYNFRMNHSYKINKNLILQLIGLYRGANTNLQYRMLSFYFLNAGARYQVFKGKGTLSLTVNDFFHTQRFAFKGERPVVQNGNYQWDSQTFFVGYTHNFGKGKKQKPKRRMRDNNEKKSSGEF